MPYKVSVDQETCIGCGACADICDNFIVKEGKSHPVKELIDEPGCSDEAKDGCPVSAISLTKLKEK
jgi:ferredoxin